jgi:hypothetical protein
METTKINNIKVKKVITNAIEDDKIGGYEMFKEPYCNIFLVSRKKSGKTNLIYNILKKCASKRTHVWVFSPTVQKDDTWKATIEMLKKKGCPVDKFVHFIDENDNSNIIDAIINELIAEAESDESEDEKSNPKCKTGCKFENEEKKEKKEYKPKKIYPNHIFCVDDLGADLRNKCIQQLLLKNRHFLSKTVISAHSTQNITPMSRANIDICIIFKGMAVQKLEQLHHDLNISVDLDRFLQIYEEATREPYSFLYINVATDEMRVCFDRAIVL